MKFTTDKDRLNIVLDVQRASAKKDNVPALTGVLVEASDGVVTFTTTNLEIGIKARVAMDVIQPGRCLVNASNLANLVKTLPAKTPIDFILDDNKLKVKYGKSSTTLHTLDDTDFPGLPVDEVTPLFKLTSSIFKELVKKTVFAVATNHFKPVFTGVLLDYTEDNLKVVGSDTHRLSFFNVGLESEIPTPQGKVIIPAPALSEAVKLFEDCDLVSVGLAGNNIIFLNDSADLVMLASTIQGIYPNYNQVIPGEFQVTVKVKSADLANAITRASSLPADNKAIPHVRVSFEGTDLVMTSRSDVAGETKEVIECLEFEGKFEGHSAFNVRYLSEIVRVLQPESEIIEFKLGGSINPATITKPGDQDYIHVLVPMRTA